MLRALENKHVAMDASEYLTASRRVLDVLRAMSLVELIVVSRRAARRVC